jgi:hypothetical protein
MKKIFTLAIWLVTFLISSCVMEQPDLFSGSPAERLNKALKNDTDSLQHAGNGWAMEYFATTGSAGYTLLVKFNASGQAIFAGKSELTGNLLVTDSCLYEMIGDNGPVLTFNSYNKVLHAFSNPVNPDGYGLEGDYEFVVLKTSSNQILLKGKKRGTIIVMNKIPVTVSWKQYFDNLDAMNTFLFTGSSNSLNLVSGNDTLVASYGATHKFRMTKPGEDPKIAGTDVPFIVTDYGLRFQTTDTIKTNSFQNFKLSDDKKRLVSTGNPEVYFTGPVLNKFLFSDLSLWKADESQMSNDFISAINVLSDALKVKYAGKRNFEYMAIANKAVYGNSFLIRVTGVEAIFRVLFTPLSGTSDRVTISLPLDNINQYDNNGKKFYTEVPEIKTTLTAFCGDYVVTSEFPLNVKTVKYSRVGNPLSYFTVNK